MSTNKEGRELRGRSAWVPRAVGLLMLLAASSPVWAAGQVVISTGVLVDPNPGDSRRVGPLMSVGLSSGALGFPLYLEASVARTDFTSLGQDYHHNYSFFMLGTEWFPVQGKTRFGMRLGLGASGEFEVVETNPPSPGGDNWIEAVVPGLVLERELGGGKRLVVGISDFVLGPWFAVLDPSEYGVEHRWRVMMGLRF